MSFTTDPVKLADDHKRCAMVAHSKTIACRFPTPTKELVTMTEAVYHATMAVFYQLRATESGDSDG